jgi:hypothetical protein
MGHSTFRLRGRLDLRNALAGISSNFWIRLGTTLHIVILGNVLEVYSLMYRLSVDLARFLIENRRNEDLPRLELGEKKPFEPRNKQSIGFIDPICAVGTDLDYLLESPTPMVNIGDYKFPPVLDGFWLYKRGELKKPDEPLQVERRLIDPTGRNVSDIIDVTDCAIVLPSDIDKLTCKTITTLEKLLEIEPELRNCLKEGSV